MSLKTISYKDWYINQKRIPGKGSEEYKQFFRFHKELCLDGFMMEGEFINPFLYWHLNFWNTEVDIIDDRGRISQKYMNPYLRDNEWIVTNEIHKANMEKKGLVILGIRRLAKSVIESSYIGWGATFDENSQNIISGLNAPDIKLITDKIDKGLNYLPEAWRWQRIEDNWKNQVTLGIKKRDGTRIPFSSIMIRNLDEGNNEEAIAGTKPRKLIIDEIGKGSFLKGLQAAIPGFTTPFGWGCSPILTGCVCKGTKVYIGNGKLVNIEDVQKDDGLIGYNGDSILKQEINWFKKPEYKDCYRIHCDNGSFIECSYDHPLLITRRKFSKIIKGNNIKRAIYQEAKHINKNDQLLLPSEIPIFGLKNIPYSRELGLLIGDGNYSFKSTPTISVSEKEIFDFLSSKITGSSKNYKISDSRNYSQVYVPYMKDKLIYHGMYGQTKDKKRLPYDIHEFDKKSCSELLGGYFDADGNVYYNKKKDIVRIVLTSVVYELLEQVKYLLLKFGIHCTITKENRNKKPSTEYKGQKNYIYRLYINQQQDIELFKNSISFLVKEKQLKLDNVKYSKYSKTKAIFEINPLNNKEGYFTDNLLNNLRYTTVTKIEHIGNQLVYNLNCGPNHNYISNGFITRQTGGDMTRFFDAKNLMFDAAAYNFLAYKNEDDDRRFHGLFISNKYRLEAKEQSTLGKYLDKAEDSEFHNIPMQVSNEAKAEEVLKTNLENLSKSSDKIPYLKEKMYYPRKVDDIFLNETANIYNIEAAKAQQVRIKINGIEGEAIELFHDGEKITHKYSTKQIITEFPVKSQSKDAPIQIWEFPIENPPFGLYVAGVDPYRQGKAQYSTSLGAVYIYKRMHDINSEKYQDMFVAAYVARPDNKDVWEEQARLLIKYYNAITLCENDDISFIEYMKAKGDSRYLERQPLWLKEIVPNTTVAREFGIHRSSEKIRDHLHTCLKKYSESVIIKEYDDEGSVKREITNMARINDPMLLEEMINHNDDDNFDREIAASLAVSLSMHLDPIIGKIGGQTDDRIKSLYKPKNNNKLFPHNPRLFSTRGKLFVR